MIGYVICNQVLQISDRYILGAFRGAAEVGIYSANYNIVLMGFGLISTPVLLAAHPIIMDAWEHNRHDDIPAVVARFCQYHLVVTAPVVSFVWVYGAEIVTLALGAEFREGHRIIPVLLAGNVAWGLAMYSNKGLELKEKTNLLLLLILISSIVNVGLNFAIVPRFGYYGAAVTTMISFMLYPALAYFVTKPHVPWRVPWVGAFKCAFCAAVAAVPFWGARVLLSDHVPDIVYVVVGGLAGLAVYVPMLFVTRTIRRGEFNDLASSR